MSVKYKVVYGSYSFAAVMFRLALAGWQVVILIWIATSIDNLPTVAEMTDPYARRIEGLAMFFLVIVIGSVWWCGTVLLAIFCLMTRPPSTLVPIDPRPSNPRSNHHWKHTEQSQF